MSQKFTCEFCNKDFATKSILKTHIESVCNRSEDTVFNCTYCNSNLSCAASLYKHIKICSKKGEYEIAQREKALLKELEETKNNLKQSEEKIKDLENELSKKDKLIIYLKGRLNIEQDSFY